MKLLAKYCAPLIATVLSLLSATSANAGVVTTYTDQASFLSSIGRASVTDNYSNPGYQQFQTDTQMSSVLGLTTYQTTGFPNSDDVWNSGTSWGSLYGANTSFVLGFNSPALGGDGVYGVGFYYLNDGGGWFYPTGFTFDALVTFADHTQEDIPLQIGAGLRWINYLGIISDTKISSIYFGLDGQPCTDDESGVQLTDLTVTIPAPEPAISVIFITGLALLMLITRQRKRGKLAWEDLSLPVRLQ